MSALPAGGRPLAIDLYCGLGGFSEGCLAEGFDCVGFDIERHVYGEHRYPAQLVVQDALTLHGSQFKTASLIVASPPCQFFSYCAMPWTKAKALAAAVRADPERLEKELALFNACFRIQREACDAAGHHIPMVVENVKGAQPWVGRARWAFGSFYLWGDVPALMPSPMNLAKVGSLGWSEFAKTGVKSKGFNTTSDQIVNGRKNSGGSWFSIGSPSQNMTGQNPVHAIVAEGRKGAGAGAAYFDDNLNERRKEATAIKNGGDWFSSGENCSLQRKALSKGSSRKFASALIAKIPEVLSRHIAATYYPGRSQP